MQSPLEYVAKKLPQKPSQELDSKTSKQLALMQNRSYLHSKGIQPGSKIQLDLLFPGAIGSRDDLRHIPNDYARSSLFTARRAREPRKSLTHEKLLHYNEHISILFTGIELRAEDDELVWLQILKYGQIVAMGDPFDFCVRDLVRDVGWAKNGRNYDKARKCISRLKASEVLALNSKAYGISGAISLIQDYTSINDNEGNPTKYRVWINKNLILLFAGNTFTSHPWTTYCKLSPVARRLTDHIHSHKYPLPLDLPTFKKICGSSDVNVTSWRQTVKRACAEVQEAKIASAVVLKNDKIYCIRE
ncbi:MAG: TrfA family protein [Sulfuriferula sp.]|nr:TrfA family protein [Sulfuriferula sp.]